MPHRNPHTPQEWREAATLAEVCLDIHSARLYGLITGGPDVDVERCSAILKRARALGIVPTSDDVNRVTQAFVHGLAATTSLEVVRGGKS